MKDCHVLQLICYSLICCVPFDVWPEMVPAGIAQRGYKVEQASCDI